MFQMVGVKLYGFYNLGSEKYKESGWFMRARRAEVWRKWTKEDIVKFVAWWYVFIVNERTAPFLCSLMTSLYSVPLLNKGKIDRQKMFTIKKF